MEKAKPQQQSATAFRSLLEEFTSLYSTYLDLDRDNRASNDPGYQSDVAQVIQQCEKIVKQINEQCLFSKNESLEEVDTDYLQFILCPALLGYFTSKITHIERHECITKAKVYFKDFLRLCRLYGVKHIPDDSDEEDEEKESKRKTIHKSAIERKEEKVRRYKEKKALDNKIKSLRGYTDESTKREYYISLLHQWILTAYEELDAIKAELPILEHMAELKSKGAGTVHRPPREQARPLRPFILTKTDIQKQVFGAGYPSVPTYTLDEFYDAQARAGQLPIAGQGGAAGAAADDQAAELEAVIKEFKLDNDDPEELAKARQWDDWKDDHRRGWGNRQNMG